MSEILSTKTNGLIKISTTIAALLNIDVQCKDIARIKEYILLYEHKIISEFKCINRIEEIIYPF